MMIQHQFGSLNDRENDNEVVLNLTEALRLLFEHYNSGILIAYCKCLAVIKDSDKFYFCDSHSCGAKGSPAANGRGCVIECDTLDELCRICRRSTGSRGQYTLDYLEINVKNILENPQQRQPQVDSVSIVSTFTQAQETGQPLLIDHIPVHTSVCLPLDCQQPRELTVFEEVTNN